jgi:hypothetical protein
MKRQGGWLAIASTALVGSCRAPGSFSIGDAEAIHEASATASVALPTTEADVASTITPDGGVQLSLELSPPAAFAAAHRAEVRASSSASLDVQTAGFELAVPVPNVERTVARIAPEARRCYQRLNADARDAGLVMLLLELSPTGSVVTVSVPSNTGVSRVVVGCVTSFARALHFSSPGGHGSAVAVHLRFSRP